MPGFWDKVTAVGDVLEDFTPVGLAADFAGGLVGGDAAVASQAKNEQELADIKNSEFVQESGAGDIYDGVTELPVISDIIKPQRSLDRGVTKAGAYIHEGIAGLFD
jgi:hypothetical protein